MNRKQGTIISMLVSTGAIYAQQAEPAKPKIELCAAAPSVQVAAQDVAATARQPIQMKTVQLLGGPMSPFHVVPLESRLEAEVPLEAEQRHCSHLLRMTVTRQGGDGSDGMGGLATIATTASDAASLPTIMGAPKTGSTIAVAAGVAGKILHRKPKPKPYEVSVMYELSSVAGHSVVLQEVAKGTGQSPDDSVLSGLLEKAANRMSALGMDLLKGKQPFTLPR
jgi:hypothetical protein